MSVCIGELETCTKCGQELQLQHETEDTQIFRCYPCRATILVNKDTGEESRIGVFRPEITE